MVISHFSVLYLDCRTLVEHMLSVFWALTCLGFISNYAWTCLALVYSLGLDLEFVKLKFVLSVHLK